MSWRTVGLVNEQQLDESMELLRATVLGHQPGTTRDEFDARSSHLVVYAGSTPVGMVRTTTAAPSLLAQWANGRWALPVGHDVVELTRGVVASDWRRHGIYRLLMLAVMAYLDPSAVRTATAAIEPDFVGRRFLAGLGFEVRGRAQLIDDAPRTLTYVVPIIATVDAARVARWRAMFDTYLARLAEGDFMVVLPEALSARPPHRAAAAAAGEASLATWSWRSGKVAGSAQD